MAARAKAAPRRPLRRLIPLIAGVATVAVVGTLAVVLDGYDAQEVPALSTSVWVTRDAGQYARVNTELAEIDTVRAADDPSVVQNGDAGLVFTQGLGRAWAIDAANPGDLGAAVDPAENDGQPVASGEATPNGTREVLQAGSWVGYRTETGRSYLGTLPDADELPLLILIDPFRDAEVQEGEEPPTYVADAIAVDENGLVALYSAAESSVRLYDGARNEFRDPVTVANGPAAEARLSMALVDGRWALFDAEESLLWLPGRGEPLDLGLTESAVLQVSSIATSRVHVADRDQLIAIDVSSGDVEQLVADATGIPAQPTVVAGDLVAAWLSTSSGLLYTESGGELPLQVTVEDLEDIDQPVPVIRSNGDRAVLNETASGMLWSVPDGTLIPVAQWSLEDENDRDEGTVQVDDVAEQEPPVAVDDTFGVRAGDLVALPLLLNDHDPNKKDVLTIAPESVSQLGPIGTFGTLSLAANNQQAVVRVSAQGGSASFTYSVTDGVSVSPPATVTLTVVGSDVNTAPEWCGVEACVQEWPSPGISAGGTVTVPVLPAWVDHEGDVIVLADAVKDDSEVQVAVVATAEGDVVVRSLDPNARDAVIPITVTVADAHGATATRILEIRVTANPALVAEPIAAVAGIGEKVTVDIAQHVRGGSGSFSIVDAVQTSAAGGLVVVPNAAAGQIDLTASAAGDYVVTYTVQDVQTQAQQSAILRVTVVGSGTPLSMAPITAFVRANEDTTVDVLGAVQNTSGRVLIVSEATSADPNLKVSVVGQSRLRVSGTTADGQPGRVGTTTVTVTDGAGATVQGTVTVFLVPSSTVSGPIAVPDTATVRAGSQADILVLANDVSPRGERVVVHPELGGSGTAGELAFVAGDRVRYLAPDVPGVYTLRYTIFLENAPKLLDSASITVTVLPPGTNRDPQPPILTARVLAGQSVAIPFSGSGIDPDGDRVVLADVRQPESGQGVAEISAEGDAIVYTAPGNGVSGGQVSFAYTVRDAQGAEAEGVVRIGVLATDIADRAPVTYGDYVRVQAGTPSALTVMPLLNDRDPLQGLLEIESVVPNAPAGSAEYNRLLELLDTDGLAAGEVKVTAGDELGVHSYVYTVVSQASFSNAQGLIVVNVTDAPSPDAPLVTDTVVTAENRGLLSGESGGSGLDVVTGKVQWASGDPAGLELAVWGSAADRYTVDGWEISGPLPDGGDVVPFSLTGPTPSGGVSVSYGFLRIPAFDDMRIQLRAGTEPIPVPEEQTRDFAVRALLDLDPGDDVEIRDDDAFTVQRANSSCAATGPDRIAYTAGREAPWTDTCTVPVRIVGQDTWTMLGVPIIIEPKDPQAILTSISRTIAPGGTDIVDLYDDMTSWEGARVGDIDKLDYSVDYSGSTFIVTPGSNGTVQIDVRADARPGTRDSIRISVTSYGGLTAGITLVVGIAPADAPRGANFTQICRVSDGASCSIVVVDKAGEYDPFAGKVGAGLHLVGVGTAGSGGTVTCPIATVRVGDERTVIATWPSGGKPVGGECIVPYTVADAQGRTGQGQLRIDVQGYPQRPASVTTTAYPTSSVTLRVTLGDARNAHPEVTGVALYEGGSAVSASTCTPSGVDYQCVVTGLVNGEDHSYTARAVNAIGESLDTTAHTTHSYQKPAIIGTPTATPVYRPGVTAQNTGVVSLSITAADDAQAFRILVDGNPLTTISRTGNTTTADLNLQPGARQLQIIPISRYSPPTSGTNEGDTVTVTAQPAGTPIVTANGSAGTAATSLTLTGVLSTANNSTNTIAITYYAWKPSAGTPTCASTPSGGHQVTGAEQTSATETISPLDADEEYRVAACLSYGFGAVGTSPIDTYTFQPPAPPTAPLTFTIDTSADGGGATRTYNLDSWDQPGAPSGYNLRYRVDGGALQNNLNVPEYSATLEGLFCKNLGGQQRCSSPTAYAPAAGMAPTSVVVRFPQDCSDAGPAADPSDVTTGAAAQPYMSVVASESTFGPWTTYIYDVTWAAPYGSLQSLHYELDFC